MHEDRAAPLSVSGRSPLETHTDTYHDTPTDTHRHTTTTHHIRKVCHGKPSEKHDRAALLARWLGIHHELRTDGPISPDWSMSIKKPYWPKIRSPGMWIQKSVTEKETVERA
jgi:hypothetical protein